MNAVLRVDLFQRDRAGLAALAFAAEAAFQGQQQRDVDGHQVGAADDRLGHVLGLGDPAGGHQRHLVPHALLDQRAVDVAQHVADVPRLLAAPRWERPG